MVAQPLRNIARIVERAGELILHHPSAMLIIIFLFHALTNAAVVSLHRGPLIMDEAFYFDSSWNMLQALTHGDYRFFFTFWDPHPPLHRILSLPFYKVFGYSPNVAVLSTLLASAVLIISLYHIGNELQGTSAGLLSAAVAVLLPGLFGFSRTYMIDHTLTAVVALSLALMLKTNGFSNRRYTFAFGLSIALGLLAKPSYTPFVIGPFLLYVSRTYKEVSCTSKRPVEGCRRRVGFLLLSVFIGLLLVSPWYISHDKALIDYIKTGGKDNEGLRIFSSRNLFYYARDLPNQLGWFLFVAAVTSLGYLVAIRHKAAWLGLLWIGVPYALFTFVPAILIKTERFVIPYLPAFALLISLASMNTRQKLRGAFVIFLMVGGLVQFAVITFASEPQFILDKDEWGLLRPDMRDWKGGEIAETLNLLLVNTTGMPAIITTDRIYSASVLRYLQQKGHLAPSSLLQVESSRYYTFFNPRKDIDTKTYEQFFINSDIALISDESLMDSYPTRKSGYIPPGMPKASEWQDETPGEAWNSTKGLFEPVKEVKLPDGDRITIYAKRGFQESMDDLTLYT